MGNFQRGSGGNRGGNFRGGNGRGDRSNFRGGNNGRRDDRDVTMHKAICSECNKSCEVPFRPSGDKPVYCSKCFSNKREDGDRGLRRDFGNRGPKRESNNSRTNQSAFSKPVFPTPASDDIKRQLGEINVKLDHLATILDGFTKSKEEIKKTSSLKATIKKITKKKTK